MSELKKEIMIPAIKDGTVIDHIPSRVTLKLMKLLDPQEFENTISLGLNLQSKKLDKKGVIKINGRFLTQDEVNKIAILAPQATVSIIKGYKVTGKIHVQVPKVIENIRCTNPNCITNKEEASTLFHLIQEEPLRIRCAYCERSISRDEISL